MLLYGCTTKDGKMNDERRCVHITSDHTMTVDLLVTSVSPVVMSHSFGFCTMSRTVCNMNGTWRTHVSARGQLLWNRPECYACESEYERLFLWRVSSGLQMYVVAKHFESLRFSQ